jgi:H/ACA ribonucleoprotein complex subunit 4
MEKFPFERETTETITIKESETDLEMASNPEKESIKQLINYGIININKPQGPTSHQTTDYVKKILNIKRAGHSGTLDPNVTGSLIIALGDATRIVHHLLKAGKEYVCLMHIHKEIKEKEIIDTINSFVKKIDQKPPVKSAVKRKTRKREIYYITILEIKGQEVLFKVGCEAGTYIRKLCHDIGQKLKTGAHMVQLIRTRVGTFNDKSWCTLQELRDACEYYKEGNEKELKKIIKPVETAVEHLQKIWVNDNAVNTLCHGADLAIPGVSKINSNINKEDKVAIMTLRNELVCTAVAKMDTKEIKRSQKGIVSKTKKVFMKRNTYKTKTF